MLGKNHPCLTGECPHQMRAECDEAIGDYIVELEGALRKISEFDLYEPAGPAANIATHAIKGAQS